MLHGVFFIQVKTFALLKPKSWPTFLAEMPAKYIFIACSFVSLGISRVFGASVYLWLQYLHTQRRVPERLNPALIWFSLRPHIGQDRVGSIVCFLMLPLYFKRR
jgi:hypothetical protein